MQAEEGSGRDYLLFVAAGKKWMLPITKVGDYQNDKWRIMDISLINNWFTYHAPKTNQNERYDAVRRAAREFALVVDDKVKDSREKFEAIEYIRLAVMLANAGIACNE